MHIEFGPQTLPAKFQMPEHANRIRRRGGHDIVLFGEPGGGAIIHDQPVLAQHQAVPHLADGQFGEGIGIDPVHEFSGIGALDVDFAQGRHIADANRFACGQHLSVNRLPPMGFTGLRKPLCPLPHPSVDKHRTLLLGPFVAGGQAGWLELFAARPSTKGTDRHTGIGRAEYRCASCCDRLP